MTRASMAACALVSAIFWALIFLLLGAAYRGLVQLIDLLAEVMT